MTTKLNPFIIRYSVYIADLTSTAVVITVAAVCMLVLKINHVTRVAAQLNSSVLALGSDDIESIKAPPT